MKEQKLREKLTKELKCHTLIPGSAFSVFIEDIIALFKEAGYVRLADDQEEELYPEVFATGLNLPTQATMEILRLFLSWLKHEAGFRKVEL